MNREERAVIAQYIKDNPQSSYPTIAKAHRLSYSTVCRISAEFEIVRPTGRKMPPVQPPVETPLVLEQNNG